MSAESLPKRAKEILSVAFACLMAGFAVGVTMMAMLDSKPYTPEVSQVAAGTTLMGGCPEVVIVTLKKGETLMSYTESNVAEGFQLKAIQGQHWTVKLKKPEGQ